METERTTLYYKEGSSDKVYKAFLIEKVDGYVVDFAYGRRGTALVHSTKTPKPLDFHAAKRVYDGLIKAKMAKGYAPIGDPVVYTATPEKNQSTGLLPQLLNPIKEEDLQQLFDEWSFVLLQTKHDGERRQVSVKTSGEVIAANRRGLQVALPKPVEKALVALTERLGKDLTLDCEDMGEHLVPFDLLQLDKDCRDQTAATRGDLLETVETESELIETGHKYLQFDIPRKVTSLTALQQWIHQARVNKAEGICLKDPDAKYTVGRPNSGGPARKLKFVESCTCVVLDQNSGKRSVQLGIVDFDQSIRFIGNVTIPPNYVIPAIGMYVEIEYLYAYPSEGSLYQPQYKGIRDDKTAADSYNSLKFKGD